MNLQLPSKVSRPVLFTLFAFSTILLFTLLNIFFHPSTLALGPNYSYDGKMGRIVHVVMFEFKDETTKEEVDDVSCFALRA